MSESPIRPEPGCTELQAVVFTALYGVALGVMLFLGLWLP